MYTPPLSQTYCKMYVSLLFRRYPDVPDFVWVAFKAARAAAPKGVKLFYNDYSINNFDRAKSTRVYVMHALFKRFIWLHLSFHGSISASAVAPHHVFSYSMVW